MKLLPTKAHFGLQRYEQIFKLPNYKDSKKSTSWLNLQDIDFINIYSTANTDLNAHLTPPKGRENGLQVVCTPDIERGRGRLSTTPFPAS